MLRCSECDVSIASCSCVVERSRFPSAAVHDVALSSDAQARYDEARRVEARGRELARAFVASGRPVLSCPPKFAVEVRATIASIARWTSDRVESARIAGLVVEVSESVSASRAA